MRVMLDECATTHTQSLANQNRECHRTYSPDTSCKHSTQCARGKHQE